MKFELTQEKHGVVARFAEDMTNRQLEAYQVAVLRHIEEAQANNVPTNDATINEAIIAGIRAGGFLDVGDTNLDNLPARAAFWLTNVVRDYIAWIKRGDDPN